MKIVIFGLTVTSSWGNGHATLWRGLIHALVNKGHRVIFFEHDTAYYASHRDYHGVHGVEIVLYESWNTAARRAELDCSDADAGIITSYCSDARNAAAVLLSSRTPCKIYYDLDTPVTLAALKNGEYPVYVPSEGLQEFDMVLSFTGGSSLPELQKKLNAARVMPLYGSVDPAAHYPVAPSRYYKADLSYLGTYADDRRDSFNRFVITPALHCKEHSFVVGGAQYTDTDQWPPNITHFAHIPPPAHPSFFCSSSYTLNITRGAMISYGYCPSGRLFEAAACGVPIITDYWKGLEEFFEPMSEILVVESSDDVIDLLQSQDGEKKRIARSAYERVMNQHTAAHRALQLESYITSMR